MCGDAGAVAAASNNHSVRDDRRDRRQEVQVAGERRKILGGGR